MPRPAAPLPQLIDDYQRMAAYVRPAPVVAVALKTNQMDEDAARATIEATERETGLVADDPVRFGSGQAARRRARGALTANIFRRRASV